MQNGMAQCGAYLGGGYVGDGVGSDFSEVGRLGRGSCSWDMCNFYLVDLTAKSDNRNGNCERGCKRKLIPKKSSLSG